MHCHGSSANKKQAEGVSRVALVGTPNVGKSVLFGLLTGKYATVSNYPGTTVEVTSANVAIGGRTLLLVDTPGVNSLIPMSEDEQVTRDILLRETPALVIQVGDSKSLRRTLAITAQVAEMGLPLVLDLNMEDEARDRGISIDIPRLSLALGVPVIGTVAPERKGLKELRAALGAETHCVPTLAVRYADPIEEYAGKIAELLPPAGIAARSLALMVLAGDETLREWLTGHMDPAGVAEIERLRDACQGRFDRPVGMLIGEARHRRAGELAGVVMRKAEGGGGSFALWLGQASMHPLWGLPILLLILLGMYEFVGVLGADVLVGLVEEKLFGEYLNPMFTRVVGLLVPFELLRDLLVGEYGQITMAVTYAVGIILPITTTFFIAFALLEDSGYLPRLAIMMNRFFNIMGLSGKAVLPMVLGLGCGTMAVMTTRILETRRDRVIATFLLALAVPCAAQLGVILGLIGSLSALAFAIWIGVVLGVLLLGGFLAARIVRGERSDFLLEIPPVRLPSLRNVLMKTQSRVFWYLKEAVPLFMLGTFALFVLEKVRLLGVIERLVSPVVVGVLGLPPRAAEAFLIGFFRRDYGAAGLYAMAEKGMLTPVQTLVSLVTLTLFVPCLAHFLMMVKERGAWLSIQMVAIILAVAVAAGGLVNVLIRLTGLVL